ADAADGERRLGRVRGGGNGPAGNTRLDVDIGAADHGDDLCGALVAALRHGRSARPLALVGEERADVVAARWLLRLLGFVRQRLGTRQRIERRRLTGGL